MDLYIKQIILIDNVEQEIYMKTDDPSLIEQLNSNLSTLKTSYFQKVQANAVETIINVQGQYESIAGTRIDVELIDFVVVGGALKYTGLNPLKVNVSACATWEAGGTLFQQYRIGIFKNNVLQCFLTGALDNTIGYPRNISLIAPLNIVEDDEIEIKVTNIDDTQDILIIDFISSCY